MQHSRAGFTIVELLIVIVVIAILAAITLVSYSTITSQANDTAIKSDLSNFAKKAELYRAENDWYPNFLQIVPLDIRVSKNSYATDTNHNFDYCVEVGGDSAIKVFALASRSKSGAIYYISNSAPIQKYNGVWPASGNDICAAILPTYTNIQRGYAPDDPAGPWRSWVGGN